MTNITGSTYPVLCRMEVLPVSGDTITVHAPFDHVLITKGTTTAALTVVLPASPSDGDMVRVSTVAAVTALTFSPTVSGFNGAMAAGVGVGVMWSAPLAAWFQF